MQTCEQATPSILKGTLQIKQVNFPTVRILYSFSSKGAWICLPGSESLVQLNSDETDSEVYFVLTPLTVVQAAVRMSLFI